MGGGSQPQINCQNIVRVFDLGLDPEAALAAPRWLMGGMDLQPGRSVDLEGRVPAWVRDALERSGFALTVLEDMDEGVGHAQFIRVGADGTLMAATDPRADGEARAG